MPAIKKYGLSALIAIAALLAGWFSRPHLDDNVVTVEFLLSEESPVVVIPKEQFGEFLFYVQHLERTARQCAAGQSL